MTRTGAQAFAEGYRKMQAGFTFPEGTCLKQQRTLWDVGSYDFTPTNGRDPWAIEAFDFAKFKHGTSNPLLLPDFVPCFWRKRGRPGHIALHLKHGDGLCLTTDAPGHPGRFGIVKISELSRLWGMEFVGWVEDLNRVRVYVPPAPVAKPKPTVPASAASGSTKMAQIDKIAVDLIHGTKAGSPKNKAAWAIHTIAHPLA